MKSLFHKTKAFALLAVLLTLVSVTARPQSAIAAPASEEGVKNIAVVSFSGYDALLADINFVGSLNGQPEMGKNLEGMLALFTQGQGLAGLDKGKPWGVVVRSGGEMPQVLGFLPVTDLKQLLDIAAAFEVHSDKGDDGVFTIQGDQPGQEIHIKEEGGWAFIAQSPAHLTNLPTDPAKLLDGLADKYDIAARLYVQNIPQEFVNMGIQAMKAGAEDDLYQRDGEDDAEFAMRKEMVESSLKQMEQMVRELDHVMFGVSLDSKGRKAFVDMQVGAVPGSELAKQMEASTGLISKFGGFLASENAVTANLLSKLGQQQIDQFDALIQGVRPKVMEEIENNKELPDDEARDLAKSIVSDLIDVVNGTIQEGTIDAAANLSLESNGVTLSVGSVVSDGKKLEAAMKKLEDLAKNEPDFPGVKHNVASHDGVDFHTITVPVPDEEGKKIFGDTIDIVLGFGAKRVFLAVGNDGINAIKAAIDGSNESSGSGLPVASFNASVGKMAAFAAEHDPKPETQMIAGLLSDADGKDHVSLTATASADTVKYRFEIEEGVLKAIAKGAQMAQQRQGGGGF